MLNELGRRNQFGLKLLNLTKNGLDIIGNWSHPNGIFIEMENHKKSGEQSPSKKLDHHLMVAVVLVNNVILQNKTKNLNPSMFIGEAICKFETK